MAKSNRCARGQHRDRYLRGGKRLKCIVCAEEFPCAGTCSHLDCALARQDPDFLEQHRDWGTGLPPAGQGEVILPPKP